MHTPDRVADCVGIVDDDADVRAAMRRLLTPLGLEVSEYGSASEFLEDHEGRSRCACVIIDVRLPGISGLELHRHLMALPRPPAVIFVSGYADVGMAVDAMRNGASDFLQKPFKAQQLLDSVQRAVESVRAARLVSDRTESVRARVAALTPRQRDVLDCLLRGLRARQIAEELHISTKTAEEHRAHVLQRMQVSSVVELVALGIAHR